MSARITPALFRGYAVIVVLTGALATAASAQTPDTPIAAGFVPLAPLAGNAASRVPGQAAASVGNLTYHGGAVQHVQQVFTIFWNPTATPFPADYQATINQFVQDLNGSPYYAIASQYGDTTGHISTALEYGGTWLDTTNAIPNNPPNIFDLVAEVNRARTANGWPADENSYFQIYTPSGYGTAESYCGYHSAVGSAFGLILFPASHGSQGTCIPSGPFPNSPAVDAAINVSAHEILETVTDPFLFGWFYVDRSGEISDLCNFDFGARAGDGSNVTLNGHRYLAQQQWSNAVSGCALSFTPPTVTMTANGQVGPLTLPPGSSLQLAIGADGGTAGFANPTDLYIGVSAPFGVLWLSGAGFTPTVTAIYHGPLPSFAPVPVLNLANVSVLPPGTYSWFVIANGANGANGASGPVGAVVETLRPPQP